MEEGSNQIIGSSTTRDNSLYIHLEQSAADKTPCQPAPKYHVVRMKKSPMMKWMILLMKIMMMIILNLIETCQYLIFR